MAPTPVPVQPVDSQHRAITEACELYMDRHRIPRGDAVMPPKKPPGTRGILMPILTNSYPVKIHSSTTIYCYDVEIYFTLDSNKKIYFTKSGKDDFVVIDRHHKCIAIYKRFLEQETEFLSTADNFLIYDGQRLLYSGKNLFPEVDPLSARWFEVDTTNMDIMGSLRTVTVKVATSVKNVIEFNQQALVAHSLEKDLSYADRSIAQFLELVFNQKCVMETDRFGVFENGKVFMRNPANEEQFRGETYQILGDGKEILPGFKKSIAFVEGENSETNVPVLVLDAMKAVFHKHQTMYEKCKEMMNNERGKIPESKIGLCVKIARGLTCYSTYGDRRRILKIVGIDSRNAYEYFFQTKDNERVTVAQYFKQKYQVELLYPEFNLVVCKSGTMSTVYPMELMTINEHQRVNAKQQTAMQFQIATRHCTILPAERQRFLSAAERALNLDSSNALFEMLGIQVLGAMKVQGRLMSNMQIQYNDAVIETQAGRWNQSRNDFLKAAEPPKSWACFFVGTPRSRFTRTHLARFGTMFHSAVRHNGIDFPGVSEYGSISHDDVEKKIEIIASEGCEYILFITDDHITDLHSLFKLKERELSVVIQDCKLTTAEKIINNRTLALDNIVQKVNMKLGGLNYAVMNKLIKEAYLVLGIGMSVIYNNPTGRPTRFSSLNPISVGYVSNAVHAQVFVGDFLITPHGPDTIVCIEEILGIEIKKFQKYRGCNPERIIVYRYGLSEGSLSTILEIEIPLARNAMRDHGVKDSLVYMVASKQHNNRFFKESARSSQNSYEGASEQNIPAGTVMDNGVVRSNFNQFYMNSHVTIQGTAKTPLYTVLADDANAPMDILERLTFILCHHHQIATLTTSLPSPLYIANEYAKRGRALWIEKMKNPMPIECDDREHVSNMTYDLCYRDTKFSSRRINA